MIQGSRCVAALANIKRLRHLLVARSAAARAGEPLMFAVGTTPLARPDAQYAGELTMVQVRGKGGDRWLPGCPCSVLVGIQWGSFSWAGPVEARRLRPGEEHTDVTIGRVSKNFSGGPEGVPD